jgi:hypothetical protein
VSAATKAVILCFALLPGMALGIVWFFISHGFECGQLAAGEIRDYLLNEQKKSN